MVEISIEELKRLIDYAKLMCDECDGPQTTCDLCIISRWEKKIAQMQGGGQGG